MNKNQEMQYIKDLYEQFQQIHKDFINNWLEHTFLHSEWWFSLLLSIIPWMLWLYFRKKEYTHRFMYAGIFVMLVSVVLDYTGISFGLWYYTGHVIPSIVGYIPYDFSLMPVTVMFLIQIKPHIAPWIKGILFGFLAAFIAEPLLVWAGCYGMTGWQHIYSFPIYVLIFICSNWLMKESQK